MEQTTTNATTTRRAASNARGPAATFRRAGVAAAVAATALLASLGSSAVHAQADSWGGQDKVKHFGVSAPLGLLGRTVIGPQATMTERLVYGTMIGALPGLMKEMSDRASGTGQSSMKDMTFNLLGAALGATLTDNWYVRPLASGDKVDGIGLTYRMQF